MQAIQTTIKMDYGEVERRVLSRMGVHPQDAWINAMPDDPYAPCPCGCGTKWRFVVKGGEAELKAHYERFASALDCTGGRSW